MDVQTLVMPAKAPESSRVGVSKGRSPYLVNHWQTISKASNLARNSQHTFFNCSYVVNWTAL